MERLTEKAEIGYREKDNDYSIKVSIQKLGQLEDIEQELGIPLEVLFKALKEGIYWDYKHREPEDVSFRLCYKELIVRYSCFGETDYEYLELKDYGFTWALTREELENAKD